MVGGCIYGRLWVCEWTGGCMDAWFGCAGIGDVLGDIAVSVGIGVSGRSWTDGFVCL